MQLVNENRTFRETESRHAVQVGIDAIVITAGLPVLVDAASRGDIFGMLTNGCVLAFFLLAMTIDCISYEEDRERDRGILREYNRVARQVIAMRKDNVAREIIETQMENAACEPKD